MQLDNEFTVPVGPDEAWQVLLDLQRVVPCFPGATLESADGDEFTGSVKMKMGSISMVYKGSGTFTERDESARRAVIEAKGRESRGSGTATATTTMKLDPDGEGTRVRVSTELKITGKVAQFGRGVLNDVADKLLTQFADCVASNLRGQ